MRSLTNISYQSQQEPFLDTNTSFMKDMTKKLEEASQVLPFLDFKDLSMQVIKKCLKKIEVDPTFADALPIVKRWVQQYNPDLELAARIMILEGLSLGKQQPQEAIKKLNKVKHLIIDTSCQYLMPKVFVLEARVHELNNDHEQKSKSLKKCIEYGESYLVEYLKQSNETRLEFADNMIIAYYEIYKITRESKLNKSIECLSKAYQAAVKNYGPDHFSSQTLSQILHQQRNLLTNMSKIIPKALTQILLLPLRKNVELQVQYSWEDELLLVRAIKNKGDSNKIIAEATTRIRLDMGKIKVLKNQNISDWLQITNSDVLIIEEELHKLVGEHSQMNDTSSKHGDQLGFRQVEKEQIFKGEGSISSSSDDEDLMPIQGQEMFLKFFKDNRSHGSRSKSKESRITRN